MACGSDGRQGRRRAVRRFDLANVSPHVDPPGEGMVGPRQVLQGHLVLDDGLQKNRLRHRFFQLPQRRGRLRRTAADISGPSLRTSRMVSLRPAAGRRVGRQLVELRQRASRAPARQRRLRLRLATRGSSPRPPAATVGRGWHLTPRLNRRVHGNRLARRVVLRRGFRGGGRPFQALAVSQARGRVGLRTVTRPRTGWRLRGHGASASAVATASSVTGGKRNTSAGSSAGNAASSRGRHRIALGLARFAAAGAGPTPKSPAPAAGGGAGNGATAAGNRRRSHPRGRAPCEA